ncbi:DUF1275 family protein [Streptomyces sp. MA5143a]|uniref:DUF1275 family protein n=1 Tax=Streptomyces sp. MA5143a TaxID=2083010 RepID=UPI000D1BC193|nr:DUF1275 family protein [Streptomyces sp. MA5143a]
MLLLTTVTGVVDAVGFVALDGVFAGDTTGNVVTPAVGGAGVREVPVTAVAGTLSGFVLGVAPAARFLSAGASAAARCRGRRAVVPACSAPWPPRRARGWRGRPSPPGPWPLPSRRCWG